MEEWFETPVSVIIKSEHKYSLSEFALQKKKEHICKRNTKYRSFP